ncbi:hypothetical protein ACET3Z_023654 [Daucus carota]
MEMLQVGLVGLRLLVDWGSLFTGVLGITTHTSPSIVLSIEKKAATEHTDSVEINVLQNGRGKEMEREGQSCCRSVSLRVGKLTLASFVHGHFA